jgi:hypothetical protein
MLKLALLLCAAAALAGCASNGATTVHVTGSETLSVRAGGR